MESKEKIEVANIYFMDVFLEKIKLDNQYTIEEFYNFFYENKEITSKQYFSIGYFNTLKQLNIYIYDFREQISIYKKLNIDSKKIIIYLEIFNELGNTGFIDDNIFQKNKIININYVKLFVERNYIILSSILKNYINYKNYLVVTFLTRDFIENIKLFLYFTRGYIIEQKADISNSSSSLTEKNNQAIKDDILKKLSIENKNWDFDIKKIIRNNPSLNDWQVELKKIYDINEECNNIIHKNGYSRINPKYGVANKIKLDDIFMIVKFFFTLIICYDGKEISSSDYLDYLEAGATPPDGCQYWIAPIYQNFINKEYSEEEKNKLIANSYMDIR